LQIVGKSSGEETLARWPTIVGMKSVEEAFGDVLKYLNNIWGTLSSSGEIINWPVNSWDG
jgi:sacsin